MTNFFSTGDMAYPKSRGIEGRRGRYYSRMVAEAGSAVVARER